MFLANWFHNIVKSEDFTETFFRFDYLLPLDFRFITIIILDYTLWINPFFGSKISPSLSNLSTISSIYGSSILSINSSFKSFIGINFPVLDSNLKIASLTRTILLLSLAGVPPILSISICPVS